MSLGAALFWQFAIEYILNYDSLKEEASKTFVVTLFWGHLR